MVAPATTSNRLTTTDDTEKAITAWLRDRFAESGANLFVLGLSGGIDSAVVCGLCAQAVGPDRVVGVIMPSSSNPDDAMSASLVAKTLGVKSLTVDLTPVSDSLLSVLPDKTAIASISAPSITGSTGIRPVTVDEVSILPDDAAVSPIPSAKVDGEARQKLATANVRPRLRMTTLYYVANLVNGVIAGTGNKSEAMIGYYTKYGDGGVDLLPIIDLFKHEVRAVAQHIGVPRSVIDRPPSAGLWQGQTDEDEIGITYDVLDDVLSRMESGDTSGIDPATLHKVKNLNAISEHKRQPIPAYRRLGS